MKRNNTVLLGLFLSLGAVAGYAQGVRTWVATTGNDLSPCSRTEPCRTFAAAIAAVNIGGEVVVLDSGGYGPVTIDKSVTVLAPDGVHAAIAATTENCITVDGGSVVVVIRNIFLNQQGAFRAVRVVNAASVSLERCTFQDFNFGVVFLSAGQHFIRDSVFRDCNQGINANGGAEVFVERSAFERGFVGITASTSCLVTARDCSFMKAATAAINVNPSDTTDNAVQVDIETCLIAGNGIGIKIASSTRVALVRVAQTRITGNTVGMQIGFPSEVISLGNNRLTANGSTDLFTSTVPQL